MFLDLALAKSWVCGWGMLQLSHFSSPYLQMRQETSVIAFVGLVRKQHQGVGNLKTWRKPKKKKKKFEAGKIKTTFFYLLEELP